MIARPLNACISVARHPFKHNTVFALVEESNDQQRCPYAKQVCRLTYLLPRYSLKLSKIHVVFLIF